MIDFSTLLDGFNMVVNGEKVFQVLHLNVFTLDNNLYLIFFSGIKLSDLCGHFSYKARDGRDTAGFPSGPTRCCAAFDVICQYICHPYLCKKSGHVVRITLFQQKNLKKIAVKVKKLR